MKIKLNRVFLYVVLYSLIFSNYVKSENYSFNFYREVFDGKENENINGFLYLIDSEENKGVYFYVTRPVKQVMTYNEKETIIYYPDEKKAFIIIENRPINLNAMDIGKKVDLRQLDFILGKTIKEKNTVIEKWVPKNIVGFPIKEIEKVMDKKARIKKIEIKDKKDKIIWQVKYDYYINVNGKDIPFIVETYNSFDNNFFQERMILSNPQQNPKLPELIKKFEIPQDAIVKKVKL